MTSRISGRSVERGFTLLELLLVTTLMAVLSAIALPRLTGTLRSSRLEEGANMVAEYVRFARRAAVERGLRVRIEFENDGNAVRLRIQDDTSHLREAYTAFGDSYLAYTRILPPRVRVTQIILRGTAGPLIPISFTPDGIGEDMEIVLRGAQDGKYRVVMGPHFEQVWVEHDTEEDR